MVSTGKANPLDVEPSKRGNVRLLPDGMAEVLDRDTAQQTVVSGADLYISHFATCPDAAAHRKR